MISIAVTDQVSRATGFARTTDRHAMIGKPLRVLAMLTARAPRPAERGEGGQRPGEGPHRLRVFLAVLFLAAAANADVAEKVDAVFADYAKKDAPGSRGRRGAGRQDHRPRARVRHGQPRVRRSARAVHDLRGGLGVEKQFTAGGAHPRRGQQGRLDDPVHKYVPELPESAAAVTISPDPRPARPARAWGRVVGIAAGAAARAWSRTRTSSTS